MGGAEVEDTKTRVNGRASVRVAFVTPFRHAFLAYPLQKHKKELAKRGIHIRIRSSIPRNVSDFDLAILTRAHFVKVARAENRRVTPHELVQITADMLRGKGVKFIFFDDRDGTPSSFFSVLPHVDLFLKRQHLKKKELYADKTYANTHSEWLVGEKSRRVPVAAIDQLHKIRVGWNCGFEDFSPSRKFAKIASWYGITRSPKSTPPAQGRPILAGFRGALGGSRRHHRQLAIDALEACDLGDIRTRGRLSRRKYLKELELSQTALSPFGFGEPCYRDFEAVLAGAVLVKPDMGHLETYPHVYSPYETYVPVRWDFSDLAERLEDVLKNQELALRLASKAQADYLYQVCSVDAFEKHFRGILQAAL